MTRLSNKPERPGHAKLLGRWRRPQEVFERFATDPAFHGVTWTETPEHWVGTQDRFEIKLKRTFP